MPTIASFNGIKVTMFWDEHPPPHFHARRSGRKGSIVIASGRLMEGNLDRATVAMLARWADEHRDALMENWKLCLAELHPNPIGPTN